MKYATKHFGTIDHTPEEGTWTDSLPIILGEQQLHCHVHIFEGSNFAPDKLQAGLALLDQLETLDKQAREEFIRSYQAGNTELKYCMQDHFECFGEEFEQQIAEVLNTHEHDYLLFLKKLKLGFVSLANGDSLEDKGDGIFSITLDYSLIWTDGEPFTDDRFVAEFDQDGRLLCVSTAS